MTTPSLNPATQASPVPSVTTTRDQLLNSALSQRDWQASEQIILGNSAARNHRTLLAQNPQDQQTNSDQPATAQPIAQTSPAPISPTVTALLRTPSAESFAKKLLSTDPAVLASLRWETGISALQVHFESLPRTGPANTLARNAAEAQALLYTLAQKRSLLTAVDKLPLLPDTPENATLNQNISTKNNKRFDFESLGSLETRKAAQDIAVAYLGNNKSPRDVSDWFNSLFKPSSDGLPSVWERMKQARDATGDQTPLSDVIIIADYMSRLHTGRFGRLTQEAWITQISIGKVLGALSDLVPKPSLGQIEVRALRDSNLNEFAGETVPNGRYQRTPQVNGQLGTYVNPEVSPPYKRSTAQPAIVTQTDLFDNAIMGRVVIPVVVSELPSYQRVVELLDAKGFKMLDWDKGLAINTATNQTMKIRNVLDKQKDIDMFDQRLTSQSKVTLSINPHDLMQQSTGQVWQSCMTVSIFNMGIYARQVARDANIGPKNDETAIVYVSTPQAGTIVKASSRTKLHPAISIDGSEILLAPSKQVYGAGESGRVNNDLPFVISQYVQAHNDAQPENIYKIKSVYHEAASSTFKKYSIPALSEEAKQAIINLKEIKGFFDKQHALVKVIESFGPQLANKEAQELLTVVYPNGIDLSGVTLKNVNLQGVNFENANLTNTKIINSNLTNTSFYNSLLDSATIENSSLLGANFSSSSLTGTILKNVDARETNFSHANLDGAKISGSQFGGAVFNTTALNNAVISKSVFNSAHGESAVFRSFSSLRGTDIDQSDFRGVKFFSTSLEQSKITKSDFGGSTFQGVNATDALLSSVDLSQSKLSRTKFDGARLRRVNLTNSTLNIVDFKDSKLSHIIARSARFSNGVFIPVSVDGFDIRGAIFETETGYFDNKFRFGPKKIRNVQIDAATRLGDIVLPNGSFIVSDAPTFNSSGAVWSAPQAVSQDQTTVPTQLPSSQINRPYSPIPPIPPTSAPTQSSSTVTTGAVWLPPKPVTQPFPGAAQAPESDKLSPPSTLPQGQSEPTYQPPETPQTGSASSAGSAGGGVQRPDPPEYKPEFDPNNLNAPQPTEIKKPQDYLLNNTPPANPPVIDVWVNKPLTEDGKINIEAFPGRLEGKDREVVENQIWTFPPLPEGDSGGVWPNDKRPVVAVPPTVGARVQPQSKIGTPFSSTFRVPQAYLVPSIDSAPSLPPQTSTKPKLANTSTQQTSFSSQYGVQPNARFKLPSSDAGVATPIPSPRSKLKTASKPHQTSPQVAAGFSPSISISTAQVWQSSPITPLRSSHSESALLSQPVPPSRQVLKPSNAQSKTVHENVDALRHSLSAVTRHIDQLSTQGLNGGQQVFQELNTSVQQFFTDARQSLQGLPASLREGGNHLLKNLEREWAKTRSEWETRSPAAIRQLADFAADAVKLLALLAALAAAIPGAAFENVFKGSH
jgi:uncharacterized protein YjbI with pentapeptide repeats